jgi:hypothetical protein
MLRGRRTKGLASSVEGRRGPPPPAIRDMACPLTAAPPSSHRKAARCDSFVYHPAPIAKPIRDYGSTPVSLDPLLARPSPVSRALLLSSGDAAQFHAFLCLAGSPVRAAVSSSARPDKPALFSPPVSARGSRLRRRRSLRSELPRSCDGLAVRCEFSSPGVIFPRCCAQLTCLALCDGLRTSPLVSRGYFET